MRVVAAIAVIVLICWAATFRPEGHDWGGDFSLYIAHARNVAEGRPYQDARFIPESKVDPAIPPQGPPSYPPVFPLLLAPVYKIFGLNYGAMRAAVQVFWLLSGWLLYVLARRRGLPPAWAAAAAGAFLLSGAVLGMKDSVLSESTYTAVSLAALLVFDRMYARREDAEEPVRSGIAAGLLLLATYLTRVTGAALAAAFALHELWRARRVRTVMLVSGAVLAAGFLLYRLTLYDGQGYSSQFRFTPDAWVRNVAHYFKAPAALWGAAPAALRYPAALAAIVLASAGLVRRLQVSPTVAEPYFVLYMIPLLLYSSAANTRYMIPVFPLLLLYAAEALMWLCGMAAAPVRRTALLAVCAVLIAGAGFNVSEAARIPSPDGPETPAFIEAAAWIRNNVPEGDTVVSWNPRVVALYTDRTSAFYQFGRDDASFDNRLREVNARWILAFRRSEWDGTYLLPRIADRPARFVSVWRNADFTLYRVAP